VVLTRRNFKGEMSEKTNKINSTDVSYGAPEALAFACSSTLLAKTTLSSNCGYI
jgi:hypothetical protein